jgi:UDP-N-acetylmuramate dehydrogenase
MNERFGAALSELTTLRVGGRARRLVEAETDEELVEAVGAADAAGEPVLILAGGSNLVISDDGFDGTVVRVASRGLSIRTSGERAELDVAAGASWDELVARCVAEQLAGVECLSGIPGATGATPIQNVGAYGQEVSQTIAGVRTYDRQARAVIELTAAECGFGYRSSAFRHADRHVVLGVRFVLERSAAARPVRYSELARALTVAAGARPPASAVREAVLELRRAKGMVIDPDDPDSTSAGSFFVNPILSAERFGALEQRAAQLLGEDVRPPAWPEGHGRVKTSAAWLIERAGFHRGYGNGRAGISQKHTLAIVNRGGASANELIALAREIRDGVRASFGVTLRPEPTLVGLEL